MAATRSPADPSVPADAGGPDPFDLARTRELVAPLYQDRALRTGEPFLAHAEGIAAIVAPLRPDPDLLAAAYLFGVYDVLRDPDEWLRARFGAGGKSHHGLDDQAEALRRMLLAMANDLRVVLLRLASRLQTLRYFAANRLPGSEPFARETLSLY